ncbi:hypothetical protein GGS26DRAFT_567884 [Hypomontagnella submonticulosa]|nr:hypothetical protein GGS26DRAFT_567884 [Hypomontagnella submonticulosa]
MSRLPEGWESDYDGSRWFYRYKTTGLTQYHFPRPGDEFPELVGLGFTPLDPTLGAGLKGEHPAAQKDIHDGMNNASATPNPGGDGRTKASANEAHMGATGYFDPDSFMYFGLNDISPIGDENNSAADGTPVNSTKPALAELHEETAQVWSPIGFMAELASGETAKCAEELAPIEMDATQISRAPLQTNLQNGPTELPTHRSPVEPKQPVQQPVQETAQPVDEYPLVSASFAYPPLKAATKSAEYVAQETASPPHPEQKVIASERPTAVQTEQNKYETWKPAQGNTTEELKNPNRQSMALSSISVLQSQNSELGPMEQKRHSLSGPVETSGATPDLPGILRPPSDPRMPVAASTPPPPSPVPAVLQPAGAPSNVASSEHDPRPRPTHNGIPNLPGSGARHESISFSSGLSVSAANSPNASSVLKPAHTQQTPPTSESQFPIQTHVNNVRPGAHQVNSMPNQSSHPPSPPKINGPGIYVFQEITASTAPIPGKPQSQPHEPPAAQGNSASQSTFSQKPQGPAEHFHSIMNEPLPVVAPLSVSKPTSPVNTLSNTEASRPPNSQPPPVTNAPNGSHTAVSGPSVQPGPHMATGHPQDHPGGPTSANSQGMDAYQPAQANNSGSSPSSISSSPTLQQKLPRKPVLPKRNDTVSPISEISSVSSANVSTHHYSVSQQGVTPPPGSTVSRPQSVSPQTTTGTPSIQQAHSHVQRPPSTSVSSQHFQAPQHLPAVHPSSTSVYTQGQIPMNNTPSSQTPVQGSTHSLTAAVQVSGSFSGQISNQPSAAPNTVHNPQGGMQRPPSTSLPSQRPPSNQAVMHNISQQPNQTMPAGMNGGQHKPHASFSPGIQPVSPLQSQVSSPAPSIASLHRPPSSASSHTYTTAQGAVAQNRPPVSGAHQNSPHVVRPQVAQTHQTQGNPQATQPSSPPITGPPKPFPMLPGQVTPLPSQVGSPPTPGQSQAAHTALAHSQHSHSQIASMKPTQQHPGNQQAIQGAAYQPPQQQHAHGNHPSVPGGSLSGHSMPGAVQHGQPRPPIQQGTVQQHAPVYSPSQIQNTGQHMHQYTGQVNQPHNGQNGQQTTNTVQGVQFQTQISHTTQSPATMSSAASTTQSFTGQSIGQGQQQIAQGSGFQSSLSQTFGQSKPFTSAQAQAALNDAGKKMKKMGKWAKKQWQNPAVKQTTAAAGGAFIDSAMGGNGVAGAAIANKIYTTTQGNPQNGQPQRPPGPQHVQTAPAQVQHVQGAVAHAQTQQVQAMGRPPLQQSMQLMGVQTPGRPPVVQNPGMVGGGMNGIAQQPQPGMVNQQLPYQVARPPVGRPPMAQAQQPAAFGQPAYQSALGQQGFQMPQGQPLYQGRPNQPMYQMAPNQPGYQAPGGPDPYAAIGATIGGALSALAKPDPAPANAPEQHQAANPPPQHETAQQYTDQSEQQHATHSEPQHPENQQYAEHSEQNQGGHSEQYHDPYSQQDYGNYSEQHQSTHTEQQNTSYTDENRQPQYTENSEGTTVVNNTIIQNVDNSTTDNSVTQNMDNSQTQQIIDNSQQTQIMDNSQQYTDNSVTQMQQQQVVDNSNTTNSNEANAFAYTDASYTDAAYTDTSYMDVNNTTDVNSYADNTAYVDASYTDATYTDTTYTDATYADMTYMDASYADATAVDITGETMYMEESVGVDASYMEASTVDYSGGDWGGDW